jgi:hypothetical protein
MNHKIALGAAVSWIFVLAACGNPEVLSLSSHESVPSSISSGTSLPTTSTTTAPDSSKDSSGNTSENTSASSQETSSTVGTSSSNGSTSSSSSTLSLPETLTAPGGLIVTGVTNGYQINFEEVTGATSYLIYAYKAEALLGHFPASITNGGVISHFSENGDYLIKIQAKNNLAQSPLSEGKTINEVHATGVVAPQVDIPSGNNLPAPRNINVTSIGYGWQLQFASGEVLAPGVVSGHQAGYRLFACLANGTIVSGYPRAIDNGYSFPNFKESGDYYMYIQAMGGENGYLDSPLSVAVKITETNPNQLPLPEEAIVTEGKPYELVAPSGFQMGVAKEDTNQDKIDEVYYNVTFTTTIYTLKISAVDTKGALLEGFPRVIENGQRIPEVTYNGTFYFYLQAQGGAYNGKTYTTSRFSYALQVDRINGENTVTSASKFDPKGIALTLPSTALPLEIQGYQDGARNIIYYVRTKPNVDPFIGDKIRSGAASIQIGITGDLGSEWHVLHSSFFDHDCWYINIHTGQVLTAADQYDFKAIVTVGTTVYAGELTTYIK